MNRCCKTSRTSLDCIRTVVNYLFIVGAVVMCSLCMFISPADAHKVNIFAYAQDSKVHAEGYFVDGTKCKNSIIEVIDNKTGQKLLEGLTDENGQYVFEIPRVTSLKLVLRAGIGHQNEYLLTEGEVREAMPTSEKRTEKKVGQKKDPATESKLLKNVQTARVERAMHLPASSEDMEALVGRVVDSKLQPVMRILVKLQEQGGKPGITEIIGGIGYIIGILGIIGYLKGRGARRNN